ncbi:MAG: phosphonopyruvate decarboxylase [Thermoprotei archaeon]|nr:MAG: phosphonopyruvate decarboxylase [Thermoprotei archaeon]
MKFIYLVIDGAPDGLRDETALSKADTPALDYIASLSRCGLMYTISRGIAPESDSAVFSILGYDPEKSYTGRGPIEALGAGLRLKEGYEVAFRANFATVKDASLELIDRRCGRDLKTEEALELAKALDGLELGKYEAYARVVATVGHRAVVIIGSRKYNLSGNVSNTDPAYEKKGYISIALKNYQMRVNECKPLDESLEAARAAELANIFTRKSFEILDKHPVNIARESKEKLKANVILLRDSGDKLPNVKPINERFGLSFSAIAEMPVEKGIARLLGMAVAEVPPPTPNKEKDYRQRLETTLKLLKKYDAVYVHLKGPDEPGHDGDLEGKIKAIELIDRYYVSSLLDNIDLENTALLITSDHSTPWTLKAHSDDPVPVLFYRPGIKSDGIKQFCEKACANGSLGVIEHGWQLLPRVIEELKSLKK